VGFDGLRGGRMGGGKERKKRDFGRKERKKGRKGGGD
jgi:hypothetical protein